MLGVCHLMSARLRFAFAICTVLSTCRVVGVRLPCYPLDFSRVLVRRPFWPVTIAVVIVTFVFLLCGPSGVLVVVHRVCLSSSPSVVDASCHRPSSLASPVGVVDRHRRCRRGFFRSLLAVVMVHRRFALVVIVRRLCLRLSALSAMSPAVFRRRQC